MRVAIESIVPMIACRPQTLLKRIKSDEVGRGVRDGITTVERERMKVLEREVKALRRANEILKVAGAFFAQAELDRRFKS
jgi:transposase